MQKGETKVALVAQWMAAMFNRGYMNVYFIAIFSVPFFSIPFHDKIFHSNENSLAKIRCDTAENGPLKVCQTFTRSLRDRVDYRFDCRLQSSEFREPDFFFVD